MQFDWDKYIIRLKLLNALISKPLLDNDDAIYKYKMMLEILSSNNKKDNGTIFNNEINKVNVNKINKDSISISIADYSNNYLVKHINTDNIFEPEFDKLELRNSDLIEIVTDFFNYYDKKKGIIAEKILKKKNFIEISESCRGESGLSFYVFKKEPYIYINKNMPSLKILISLIHEMSHIISYIEYKKIRPLLIELPTLNAEINALTFLKNYKMDEKEIDKLEMAMIDDYVNIFISVHVKTICRDVLQDSEIRDKEKGIIDSARKEGYAIDKEMILKAIELDEDFSLYAIPFFYTYVNRDFTKKELLEIEKEFLIKSKKYAFSDFDNSINRFNEYTKTLSKKIKN